VGKYKPERKKSVRKFFRFERKPVKDRGKGRVSLEKRGCCKKIYLQGETYRIHRVLPPVHGLLWDPCKGQASRWGKGKKNLLEAKNFMKMIGKGSQHDCHERV